MQLFHINIDPFRDLFDWWVSEIQLSARHVLDILRRSDSRTAVVPSVLDRKVPPCDTHLLVFTGRWMELPRYSFKLPLTRAWEVAEATICESTPFSPEEVVSTAVLDPRTDRQHLVVIKRDALNDFLDSAVTNKKPEGAAIIKDGASLSLPARSLEGLHPVFAHLRHRRQWILGATVSLLFLFGATYIHLYLRFSLAETQLESAVEAKRAEALEVRELLDQQQKQLSIVQAARDAKDEAITITQLWEEITRVLPDSAWISDMSFDGEAVTLIGYADKSAELIKELSTSAYMHDPGFVSPVVRVPGKSGERFEIRARVFRQ